MAAGRRGSTVDWESIARGMIDFTTPFSLPAEAIPAIIGANAFRGRENLTEVTFLNTLTTIKEYAFYSCKGLTSVVIPDSVTSVETRAFQLCTSLSSAIIGTGLTNIPSFMFSDCTHLGTINIPNSVTSIGREAFYSCGFRSVVIPDSVTSIAQYAFANCRSLTNIVLQCITPPTLENVNAFNNTNCPIYVPDESVAAYKAANNWSSLASRIFPMSDLTT